MSGDADQAARLRAALDRLAKADEEWVADPAPDRAGETARRLDVTDTDAVMDVLLQEISDTVMPARVVLSSEAGHLAIAAAGRRVQGVLAGTDSILGGLGSSLEQVFDAEAPEAARELGEALRRLLNGTGPVTLRSEVASRLGAESEPGLSPSMLKDLWGVEAVDADTPALHRFLKRSADHIRGGLLRAGDEVTLLVGDETLEEPLIDVLDAAWPDFASERAKASKDHSDPSLTCWHQPDGPVVAVAAWSNEGDKTMVAAMAFLPDVMDRVLAEWTAAIGTAA